MSQHEADPGEQGLSAEEKELIALRNELREAHSIAGEAIRYMDRVALLVRTLSNDSDLGASVRALVEGR